jgi:hypothetical protein
VVLTVGNMTAPVTFALAALMSQSVLPMGGIAAHDGISATDRMSGFTEGGNVEM